MQSVLQTFGCFRRPIGRFAVALVLFVMVTTTQAQGVVAKYCDGCGRAVPLSTQIGDLCPHCNGTFGAERTIDVPSMSNGGYPGDNYSGTSPVYNQYSLTWAMYQQARADRAASIANRAAWRARIAERRQARRENLLNSTSPDQPKQRKFEEEIDDEKGWIEWPGVLSDRYSADTLQLQVLFAQVIQDCDGPTTASEFHLACRQLLDRMCDDLREGKFSPQEYVYLKGFVVAVSESISWH